MPRKIPAVFAQDPTDDARRRRARHRRDVTVRCDLPGGDGGDDPTYTLVQLLVDHFQPAFLVFNRAGPGSHRRTVAWRVRATSGYAVWIGGVGHRSQPVSRRRDRPRVAAQTAVRTATGGARLACLPGQAARGAPAGRTRAPARVPGSSRHHPRDRRAPLRRDVPDNLADTRPAGANARVGLALPHGPRSRSPDRPGPDRPRDGDDREVGTDPREALGRDPTHPQRRVGAHLGPVLRPHHPSTGCRASCRGSACSTRSGACGTRTASACTTRSSTRS
jgi:hypothetical protein